MLSDNFKYIIKKQALEQSPKECCGLIVKDVHYRLFPCDNTSDSPNYHFLISEEEKQKIQENGKLTSFYHSHPQGGDFSIVDRVMSERTNLNCILYDCVLDKFSIYEPCGYQAPYQDRPHIIGVLDCIILAKDYYQRELNISLPHFEHKLRYWDAKKMKENLEFAKKYDNHPLTQFYIQNNFIKVNAPQKHDLILYKPFREAQSATGVLVYLGNGKVLCHMENSKSKIELYRTFFQNMTVDIVRHKNYIH